MTKSAQDIATDLANEAATSNETNPVEVAKIVLSVAVQARVPVFIYSEPGTGKSASVRALAEAQDMANQLHTIMLSVREPTDQGGLPAVYDDANGQPNVRLVPPGWARDIIRDKRGIVFFDEISCATPAVMNSALRIVQEGVIGDSEKLPENTAFVMAGNPPDTNVGANSLTAGIANRSLHLSWPWSYENWRDGMLRQWKPLVAKNVKRLPPDWRTGIGDMTSLVIAFLDTRPSLAQKQPADLDEQGKAWPSGRTWDLAIQLLTAANSIGYGPRTIVARTIVAGLVGESVQTQWNEWIANMDLPSTKSVLDDPSGFRMPERLDQVAAVLAGVVAYVHQDSSMKTFQAAWAVVNRVITMDRPAIAVATGRILSAKAPQGALDDKSSPYAVGILLLGAHLKRAKVDHGRAS